MDDVFDDALLSAPLLSVDGVRSGPSECLNRCCAGAVTGRGTSAADVPPPVRSWGTKEWGWGGEESTQRECV